MQKKQRSTRGPRHHLQRHRQVVLSIALEATADNLHFQVSARGKVITPKWTDKPKRQNTTVKQATRACFPASRTAMVSYYITVSFTWSAITEPPFSCFREETKSCNGDEVEVQECRMKMFAGSMQTKGTAEQTKPLDVTGWTLCCVPNHFA